MGTNVVIAWRFQAGYSTFGVTTKVPYLSAVVTWRIGPYSRNSFSTRGLAPLLPVRVPALSRVQVKKSIASVALGGSLVERLTAIAAVGFDGVEIFTPNLEAFDGSPRDLRQHVSGLGLSVELYQPLRDFEGSPDTEVAGIFARAEAIFDTMQDLGAPLLLVCSNTQESTIDDDARAADQLAALAERAAKRNLRVGYEALAWGRHVKTFDRAWKIVEMAAQPNLGLILDSFHTLVRPEDWSTLRNLPGDRIEFVQVGDAPRMNADPLTIRRNHSRFPGLGELGVSHFIREVLATGYTGTISIEIFNEKSPTPPLETARIAMAALESVIAQAQDHEDIPG
jgi:4-hydroxyphenylpyruvate dioxygenase